MRKILTLMQEPLAADANALNGHEDLRRVDMGEFRNVYRYDKTSVRILVLWKRNDDHVYTGLSRKNI